MDDNKETRVKGFLKMSEKEKEEWKEELELYSAEIKGRSGANLRNLRQAIGVRLLDMAEIIGVSKNTLTGYENGKSQMSLEALIFYCDISNQDPTTFLQYKSREERMKSRGQYSQI